MGDHYIYIESLKGELSQNINKKSELEKQICEVTLENGNLSESLNFSHNKILLLEKRHNDQSNLLRSTERELGELRASNSYLTERLETLSNRMTFASGNGSFMSEIENFGVESWPLTW